MNKLPKTKRIQVLNLLLEGVGIQPASRLTGVSTRTIQDLLKDAGEACKEFHDEQIRDIRIEERIEIDEMWAQTYCKEKNVPYAIAPPRTAGDCYCHMALDATSKLILTYGVGKRRPIETYWVLKDLRKRIVGIPEFATDGYIPYTQYIPEVFGEDVPLAQTIRRTKKVKVSGNPDMKNTDTTFVERLNLSLRMHIRRYNRKTNAYSKRVSALWNHTHLFVTWYNFVRIHDTLGTTPAVAMGLCEEPCDLGLIVKLIEVREPPPKKRGPYRKCRSKVIVNRQ